MISSEPLPSRISLPCGKPVTPPYLLFQALCAGIGITVDAAFATRCAISSRSCGGNG